MRRTPSPPSSSDTYGQALGFDRHSVGLALWRGLCRGGRDCRAWEQGLGYEIASEGKHQKGDCDCDLGAVAVVPAVEPVADIAVALTSAFSNYDFRHRALWALVVLACARRRDGTSSREEQFWPEAGLMARRQVRCHVSAAADLRLQED